MPCVLMARRCPSHWATFFTIREILDKYHPEVVRYLLISSQYRSAINYSEESLKTAKGALDRFYKALKGFEAVTPVALSELDKSSAAVSKFIAAMDDDFNTPEALAAIFELVRELNTAVAAKDDTLANTLAEQVKSLGDVLGLLSSDPNEFLQAGSTGAGEGELSAEAIEQKIAERIEAKNNKDYALSDHIRDDLKAQGVILEDSPQGTTWRRE